MLTAEADTERLLEPLLQFSQGAIRLFPQLTQQLGFHRGCYSAHGAVTALRDPFHLLAVQSLAGNLLGPVIADREHLCQRPQRSLPAIIGRQQLASKII
jgi:hypothetical protein